jgi:hypothetical protein
MKKFDYTTLTWSELLTKTKDWFNAPRAVTEALKRLKTLIDNIPSGGDSRPYKVYTALLTQSGTDAPVATVLENTLGATVSFTRTNTGVYKAVFSNEILTETNHSFLQGAGNAISLVSIWGYYISSTEFLFECYDLGNVGLGFETKDDILDNQFIEIRVYN